MAHDGPKGTPNLNTPLVFVIGICSTLVFIAAVMGIWAGYEFVWNAEVYEKQVRPVYQPLVEHKLEQQKLLDGSAEGSMSIEQAMQHIATGNPRN